MGARVPRKRVEMVRNAEKADRQAKIAREQSRRIRAMMEAGMIRVMGARR